MNQRGRREIVKRGALVSNGSSWNDKARERKSRTDATGGRKSQNELYARGGKLLSDKNRIGAANRSGDNPELLSIYFEREHRRVETGPRGAAGCLLRLDEPVG